MKISLASTIRLFLVLSATAAFLNGCAPHRVYYPRGPSQYEREQIPPREQQREDSYQRRETAPEGAHGIIPGKEEGSGMGLNTRRGPAQTLYTNAQHAIQKKEYNRAEMLLNRALRVEPRNGWYWHAMGRVKYAQGAYGQAIQFCLKSNNLAGQDTDLVRANRLLMHQAKERNSSGNK